MHSILLGDKSLDYKWKRSKGLDFPVWNFYIGDIFIGQIFNMRPGYSAVTFHTVSPYGVVDGFRTRMDCSQFMLQLCGFIKKEY